MKRFFLLLLSVSMLAVSCAKNGSNDGPVTPSVEESFPEHDGYRIYVVDNTGWNALYLYMYGSVNNLGGSWPGIKSGGKLALKGKEYIWFGVSTQEALGATEQIIFNNGSGAQVPQAGEGKITFGENADYFFTVTAEKAVSFDGGSTLKVDTRAKPITAKATKLMTFDASNRVKWQIYQVNPRLYGGSNNFSQIEARLDEIASLGTDVLYLMPMYAPGSKKSIGSPYCIKDFTSVNSSYGTMDNLRSLINAAHDKGMKVIFDWVANHTAWDCSWITSHKDWYVQDASGNIVYPTADGDWTDVAQLNYDSTDLHAAMTSAMTYWADEVGIDGYRCDYAHGITGSKVGPMDTFWKSAITTLEQSNPDLIMLAESDFTKMYDDGFDMIYSRGAKSRLISGFGKDLSNFFNTVSSAVKSAPASGSPLLFITNHDECTTSSPVQDFKCKEGALAAYLLIRSLPVATMMYGSQEVAYPSTINFFNSMTMRWEMNPEFKAEFTTALQQLSAIDRSKAADIYTAGPVAIVTYGGKGLIVNTSASEVTVQGLSSVPLGSYTGSELILSAYGYKIF